MLLALLQTWCLHRLSRVAFTSLTALSHILSHSLTYGIIPYTQSFTSLTALSHILRTQTHSVLSGDFGSCLNIQVDTNRSSAPREAQSA